MRKLMAALLAMLMLCGYAALGEEAASGNVMSGAYLFELPDGTAVNPEYITDGVHGFVVKNDGYEIIGVTVDYQVIGGLQVADGEDERFAHHNAAMRMIFTDAQIKAFKIQKELGEVETAGKNGKKLLFTLSNIDDVTVLSMSGYENQAGYLVVVAGIGLDKDVELYSALRYELASIAESAELQARFYRGEKWVDIVQDEYTVENGVSKPKPVQLRAAPNMNAEPVGTIQMGTSYKCLGFEGEYYKIDVGGKVCYVHQKYVKERE